VKNQISAVKKEKKNPCQQRSFESLTQSYMKKQLVLIGMVLFFLLLLKAKEQQTRSTQIGPPREERRALGIEAFAAVKLFDFNE
jgi:hypothetical protein